MADKKNVDFFLPYMKGKKRHKNYMKALDVYHHITFHTDGYFSKPWITQGESQKELALVNPYFSRLIDQRRPSETATILGYRRQNYLPITKVPANKVISSLSKIVKCADWCIDYSHSEVPPTLSEYDTLEHYCEKVYPKDDSIENWTYRVLIKWMLTDPNALMVVMPLSWPTDQGELLRPYAHIIQCKDVFDYKEGESAVFLSPYVTEYTVTIGGEPVVKNGKIIIYVDKDSFTECRQIGEESFEIVEHPHNIGECPAWLLGGEAKTPDMITPFYDSYIAPMLPSLDAAARDSSDLDAEKVQHLFSTMWYVQTTNCSACQGIGYSLLNGSQVACTQCDGRGTLPKSPYRDFEINLNSGLGEMATNVPIPPAGYITKPTEMVGLMRNEIKCEIKDALASLNMEFLADEPLNESGKAKEVDRDELNNFVYKVGYHLVESIISPVYWFINEMRYKTIIPDLKTREKMLPKIPVPQNFDLFKSKTAEDNLIKIAASPVSSEIKELAEMEFINERYQEQPEVRDRLIVIRDHNPLNGYTTEQIESLLTANLIMKVDAILAVYLSSFVSEILANDHDFLHLDYDKQREVLYEMAQKKLDEMESDKPEPEIMPLTSIQNNPVDLVPQKINNEMIDEAPRKKERDDLSRS